MPPPLFDDMQIANALRNEALPALERLTESSSLSDNALRRFDRDDPPPYASSTQDDNENMAHLALNPVDNTIQDKLNRLLDKPLDNDQRSWAARGVVDEYKPGVRYENELKLEKDRIRRWTDIKASNNTRDYFIQLGPARKGRAGDERVNIIARRNIKHRWQKLGIWNPE